MPVPRRIPPHVVLATPRFFPDTGGVESHVYEVARRLSGLGFRVAVLATDNASTSVRQETVEGVRVVRVPALPRGRDWRYVRGIGRYLTAMRPDLVHVHSYHTFVAPQALAWATRRRVPRVLTFHAGGHSSGLRTAVRPAQQWALRPLLARASRLVVLSEWERDVYVKRLHLPPQLFACIPNGADLPAVDPLPPTDPDLVVSVGRLERYKGHHRVIAAMPELRRRRPSARLWIAGAGPAEAELRAQAERLGVAPFVEISAVPPDRRREMAERVARAGVVALLSDFETQPIAALEALSLGRPLVVADRPGLTQLAARGLADAIDADAPPAQVAAALEAAIDRPPAGRELDLPTWDACAADLAGLYRDILAR